MGWMIPAAIVASTLISSYMSNQAQQSAGEQAASAQRDASGRAAEATLEGTRLSIEEQRRQFDLMQERYADTQKLLAPYIQAGGTALTEQMNLAGLFGAERQREATQGISNSPLFQSLAKQGEEGMLQASSATGGVRGGNVQSVLAQYRPAMLKQEIESQYQRLGGLSQMGQNAAAGTGAAGMSAAGFGAGVIPGLYGQQGSNLANVYSGMGDIEAQRALYKGASTAGMYSGFSKGAGLLAGMYNPKTGGF